jgi:hypothetical protein
MNRAIVWFCWGARFVAEAIASARTTTAVDADRVLITDRENAAVAEASGVFATVLPIDLQFHNNLEKSRLVDLVPGGYDSYLYLDADTRVFGDLSLGFESVEMYGVAIAAEPNYDLGAFFGFGSVMAKLGIAPRAQLLYNSGVFFFTLNETVRPLFEAWRDLCATLGPETGIASDQAFLSLAFEQHRFRPYVLSPAYNYRGFGEHAVGPVRIWHSKFDPPADLNAFDDVWPGRRFLCGRRMPPDNVDAEATEPSAPLQLPRRPQAMLRLKLREFAAENDCNLSELTAANSSRAANEALLRRLGFELHDHNDAYYAEALDYHLGLMAAYRGQPERMAEHLRRSRTMPSSEDDDELFSDHVNISHATRAHQQCAISRGLPAILISAMQRHAARAFSHSLARLLGMPLLRLAVGQPQQGYLVPSWLDMFLEGGAVALDDFAASDFNLGVLGSRRLPGLFVLIRDPRAAACCFVRSRFESPPPASSALDEQIESACVAHFIPWLLDWIDRAERNLCFTWLRHRQILVDRAASARAIAAALSDGSPAMRRFAKTTVMPQFETPIGTDDDDSWRDSVGSEARARMWAACTPKIRALLDLEP